MTTTYEIGPLLGGVSLLTVSLLWYFVWSVREVSMRWLDQREQTLPGDDNEAIDIPDDLMGLALGETEKWAQDSTIAAIREKWDTYRDWNKVRTSMGVAHRDD